jgi:hypothetical protein
MTTNATDAPETAERPERAERAGARRPPQMERERPDVLIYPDRAALLP